MIRINQLTLEIAHEPEAIRKKAAKLLKVAEKEIEEIRIVRRSVDARKKDRLLYSYIVDVELSEKKKEPILVKKAKSVNIRLEREKTYRYPERGETMLKKRPVIVGAGPAGLFAALALSENGYAPILLEQGDPVEIRTKKVEAFWKCGFPCLEQKSNVQFGEGGAGTFSDGKLNTLVKDTSGRNKKVLETFVEAGAAPLILYDSKPHIGTDVLRLVVKNIRERILQAGGEVRFGACVTDFEIRDQAVFAVEINDTETLPAEQVVLCTGHSARELFAVLNRHQVYMEPKPFAVGFRIQHPQKQINLSQYGWEAVEALGAAPYKVTAKSSGGRGVYSFCMCPGGYVVNASSEPGRLAVNGMSNFSRDSANANSAIVVAVMPKDFSAPGPLGGVEFQRRMEETAFLLGEGRIPIQLYGDFKENRRSHDFGDVGPEFCGKYAFSNLRTIMPEELNLAFMEGMEQFGRKIRDFDRPDAILAGIESRTSSPLRIVRGESFESSIRGIYPCGEGAGYAGGITSAAMDGLKVAEEIIKRYRPGS